MAGAVEVAGGLVGIAGADRPIDLIDADAFSTEGLGIDADAHGVFLGAIELHLGNAIEGREPLGHPHLGHLGDL